jgi:hypothetical protein
MKVGEVIKHLKGQYDMEDEIAFAAWCAEDVDFQAGEGNLTDEQIDRVLRLMDIGHDSCIGLNWDVLDVCIEEVINGEQE